MELKIGDMVEVTGSWSGYNGVRGKIIEKWSNGNLTIMSNNRKLLTLESYKFTKIIEKAKSKKQKIIIKALSGVRW